MYNHYNYVQKSKFGSTHFMYLKFWALLPLSIKPSTFCKMVKWPTNKALINQYLTIPKIESIESCSEKAKGKDFHYLGKG